MTMKQLVAIALALGASVPAVAATSIGVSIGIQQPGVYGRIDIGNYPQPEVVYAEPVLIQPSPVARYQRPIYLYVPDADQRDWAHRCQRYSACGQPVYFVREQWVRDRYRQEHRDWRDDRGPRSNGRSDSAPGHRHRIDERRHGHDDHR
jgi:hypothetical protein